MTVSTRQIVIGSAAGLIAGLAASFAMDRFQAAVTALSDSDDSEGEPATQQAADAAARAVTGQALPPEQKPLGGEIVHYALGAALGAGYGAAAAVWPSLTSGYGTAFGAGTAALLDEAAVPALGFGDAPWEAPAATHVYTASSHLVFGVTLEAVRRLVQRAFGA